MKILLVDDDPMVRSTLRLFSRRIAPDGRVIEAASGEAALGVLAGRYDLLVVDLRMPGMGGLAFIRRVRARLETAAVPILVISGNGTPDTEQSAFDAGATAFLAKPLGFWEFRRTVNPLTDSG